MKNAKRRDVNQLAKAIVDEATSESGAISNYAAQLGRLGGLKGGRARAKKLSKAQRRKIAKAGAKARWGRKKQAT